MRPLERTARASYIFRGCGRRTRCTFHTSAARPTSAEGVQLQLEEQQKARTAQGLVRTRGGTQPRNARSQAPARAETACWERNRANARALSCSGSGGLETTPAF